MRTIILPKASPIGGMAIEDVCVQIGPEECPEMGSTVLLSGEDTEWTLSTLDDFRLYYRYRANTLVSVMCESLPQGLVDAVLYLLMEKKASLFRGPMK